MAGAAAGGGRECLVRRRLLQEVGGDAETIILFNMTFDGHRDEFRTGKLRTWMCRGPESPSRNPITNLFTEDRNKIIVHSFKKQNAEGDKIVFSVAVIDTTLMTSV